MQQRGPSDPIERYAEVLDALPIMSYLVTREGALAYISRAASERTGCTVDTAPPGAYAELAVAADRERAVAAWNAALENGRSYSDRFRLRHVNGTYRWVLNEAAPIVDAGGDIVVWIGILLDIEEQYSAAQAASRKVQEALIASESAARALASAIPGVTWTASPDGRFTQVSDQWQFTMGLPNSAALDGSWLDNVYPEDREPMLARWNTSLATGAVYDTEFRIRLRDGKFHWILVRALPIINEHRKIVQWIGVYLDIDDRHRADRERERVYRGLRLLAQTGSVALTSLESLETLRLIARACASNFASFCLIDMVNESGSWERTAAHRNPELAANFDTLTQPADDHPIAVVLREHRSSVIDVNDQWLENTNGLRDRVELYHRLGVRSLITVPIVTPSAVVVGALTCGLDASHIGDPYVQDDRVFVEEVGRRLGSLVENTRLYERERRIAVELQAASLPATLPHLDHLHLDADYRPGSDEATIGGDWYDAFILKDGRVAITVGDVLGHGLRAAVTMTKLRQAMQSAAMLDPEPNLMLKVADETLKLIDPENGYATALALIYDPVRSKMTFASAGHPGPVIRRPDGSVDDLTSPGIMLGLRDGSESDTCTVDTPHGTTFILFTDGITEATRDIQSGYDRLHAAAAEAGIFSQPHPARAIVEHVLGTTHAGDDIAVLVATIASPETQVVEQTRYPLFDEVLPDLEPLSRPQSVETVRTSRWQFQSDDADSARAVRHSFIAYAHSGSTFTENVDLATAELVLGELVGNVVRHAPGRVTIDIEWRADAIEIAVTDEGPVFPLPDASAVDPLAESGRGLKMIAQCTSVFRVVPGPMGGCRAEVLIPHIRS